MRSLTQLKEQIKAILIKQIIKRKNKIKVFEIKIKKNRISHYQNQVKHCHDVRLSNNIIFYIWGRF